MGGIMVPPVYRRFSIIIVLVFAAFAGAYYFWQSSGSREFNETFVKFQKSYLDTMESFVGAQKARMESFVRDYSIGDDIAQCAAEHSVWDPGHSSSLLSANGLDSVWLLDADLNCVTSFSTDRAPGAPEYYSEPFFTQSLRDLLRGANSGHFYMAGPGGIMCEIAFFPVQPASDIRRMTAPRGFLVAIRKWTQQFCNQSADIMRADLSVVPARGHVISAASDWSRGDYTVEFPFVGRSGDILAYLVATTKMSLLENGYVFFSRGRILLFGGIGVLCLVVLLVGYASFASKISRLVNALKVGDMRILGEPEGRSGDYARLAQAVKTASSRKSIQSAADMDQGRIAQDEKFLDIILRSFPGIVMVVSGDGVLSRAEGRDVRPFGIQKERDIGRPISNIFRGQERLEQFESALQGKRSSREQNVGDRIFVTTCEAVKTGSGERSYVVVVAVDVTEKYQSDDILTRARSEAARAERIKTQFLSVVSHETRTPLNGVLGFASVLRETPLNEEQSSYLDRIVDSGQNLLNILSDILDLTKLEAGEKQVKIEPLSLPSLVYQLAERYRLACHRKEGLEFVFDIDQRLPDLIAGDNEMITRVLSNLLDNAVKFTDVGHVKFSAAWVPHDRDGGSGVLFTVSDTGPGIAPEIARDLFEPFHQGDSSKTREHGGLGLGMTIANKLAIQLRGRLKFETKQDMGTTFTFFLPAEPVAEETMNQSGF